MANRSKKIEKIENTNAVLVTEENDDIDVLDRKEFIDRIKQTIEYHADKKQSVSFSIQGSWGIDISSKLWNQIHIPCGNKIFNYKELMDTYFAQK